jgi:hypothetical protein
MIKAPPARLLSPTQSFTRSGKPIAGLNLGGYWSWGYSALLANKARGVLCEFIVAQALGLASNGHDPWGTHDLVSATGTRIEVKSTAYLQSWDQKELSRPSWQNLTSRRVEPAADGSWTTADAKSSKGDVYVLALFTANDHASADPLDLDQWVFWVVPGSAITTDTMTLSMVDGQYRRLGYDELRTEFETAERRLQGGLPPPLPDASPVHSQSGATGAGNPIPIAVPVMSIPSSVQATGPVTKVPTAAPVSQEWQGGKRVIAGALAVVTLLLTTLFLFILFDIYGLIAGGLMMAISLAEAVDNADKRQKAEQAKLRAAARKA